MAIVSLVEYRFVSMVMLNVKIGVKIEIERGG